ncbi:hypothetical protein EJB05_08248, partial [Eragrostis curvula]
IQKHHSAAEEEAANSLHVLVISSQSTQIEWCCAVAKEAGPTSQGWDRGRHPRLTDQVAVPPSSIHPFTRSPVSQLLTISSSTARGNYTSLRLGSVPTIMLWARMRYLVKRKMSSLDATRAELGLVVLYLNKAEARDKICRAIQYGSKFISNGQPGTAQDVDRTTTLARKVFRLAKFFNDLHALISPPAKGTPLTLVLLGKSRNALLSTFLFLDQFVWAGRTGIIKNKEATDRMSRLSLYCWMASSVCGGLVELGELKRLSKSMRKLSRELRDVDKYENEQYRSKMQQSDARLLALVRAAMDVVVAIGLLQLAPKKVTPRVTGAFGFITSLIACYQVGSASVCWTDMCSSGINFLRVLLRPNSRREVEACLLL